MDAEAIQTVNIELTEQIQQVIVGHEHAIQLMFSGLLCEGHVLLEGVPGTAKTLLARCFASCLSLEFGRIQFTPDLMPGDVIGTNLFDFKTNQFALTKGPIFAQILLTDEINRTPPKTQAALLQAMQERTVTIDRETYKLDDAFMVIATQNPIEQQGTYPLPEAQLDRFLFKVLIDYPTREQERDIVMRHGHRNNMPRLDEFDLKTVADAGMVTEMRDYIAQIRLSEDLVDYIVDLVRGTREHPSLEVGSSPRSASMLAGASRAFAALNGRDYVLPDDVKLLAIPTLRHRVVLAPGAEIEGLSPERIVGQIIEQVAAPR